jgi:hypothetical protein
MKQLDNIQKMMSFMYPETKTLITMATEFYPNKTVYTCHIFSNTDFASYGEGSDFTEAITEAHNNLVGQMINFANENRK